MGCLTTYGIGSAPPYYGAGYVPQAKWYQLGGLMSVLYLSIWVGVGGERSWRSHAPTPARTPRTWGVGVLHVHWSALLLAMASASIHRVNGHELTASMHSCRRLVEGAGPVVRQHSTQLWGQAASSRAEGREECESAAAVL
jgi:hypothetical protein